MNAWRFTRTDVLKRGGTRVRTCTVAADAWFDARAHARGILLADLPLKGALEPNPPPLECAEAPQAEAEWVLRWVGHDAGRVPARRLVVERVARRRT